MTNIPLIGSGLTGFIEEQSKDVFYYNQAWLDLVTQLYGYTAIPLTTTNADGKLLAFSHCALCRVP